MNILFVSISPLQHASIHSISQDLLRALQSKGHKIHIVCAVERKLNQDTYIAVEDDMTVLRVKIGNNKKANLIEKGLTTLMLPKLYIKAIKKYFSDVKFDLVLYPTPPVTHMDTVRFVKKRDGAKTYLMLKDIFPQNAVDIGMMKKSGPTGIIYKNFRRKEKKLYAISDRIGCMSQANVDYVIKHNPEVDPGKVELCPNSIEVNDMSVDTDTRKELREKYEIPLDKKVFIYGGNLGKPQGIGFVIKCLEKLKDREDVYFLIVGDGTEFKKLESWFREHKPGNMKLLKKIIKQDYDRLAAACDVGLIFLDHRFTIPNFPSRLLSHMQAKQPVLACTDPNTDVGKVITEGGFGWWCESNSTDAFSACVNEACKADLEAMGIKGFEYLKQHYDAKPVAQKILDSLS